MGTIEASDSGYVALLANTVQNDGTIKAYKGTVHLTGASEATINLNGNSIVSLTVNKGVLDALVENKGAVLADGGKIFLTTNAVDEILKGVVNNTGLIEANSLDDISGEVILFAHGGTANVSGTIEAVGGFVETSGKELSVDSDTVIKAKKWLIDPVDVTIVAGGSDAVDSTSDYPSISATAIETALATADVIIEATNDITVNEAITVNTGYGLYLNASNDINVNAAMTVSLGILNLHALNDININETIDIQSYKSLNMFYGNKLNLAMNSDKTAFIGKVNLGQNSYLNINYDYYTIINNLEDLANLEYVGLNDSGLKYVLGADLTQADSTLFDSIGNGDAGIAGSFTGTFNGLGHSITNLTISEEGYAESAPNGVGLFGNIAGTANISNLALINPTVTNTYNEWDIAPTGALVGFATSTTSGETISNIIITGADVKAFGSAGGAIGQINIGKVNNVNVSTSTISGDDSVGGSEDYYGVGGVVGYNYKSNIDNASSVGNTIEATSNGAGGIVGETQSTSSISNSNASGNTISGKQDVGGIVGYMDFTDEELTTLSNNYYKLDDTTINDTLGAITYGGIYEGQYDTWLTGSKAALVADAYFSIGAATAESAEAYIIEDMQDLRNLLAFTNTPEMPIKLANNITLDAEFYLPMFNGYIDGKGYTLSGLNVNQPYNANIGLVGVLLGGIIGDLTLASPSLKGYSNVGSIVGMTNGGIIISVTATGVDISIDASDIDVSNVGGLVGYMTANTAVAESSASGAININLAGNDENDYSIKNIGGLVGLVTDSYQELGEDGFGVITNFEESKTTDVSITIGADADAATTNYFEIGSIGGLVGANDVEDGEFLISNTKATGDILISSENTDGIEVYSIGGAVGYSSGSLDNIIANNDITITSGSVYSIGGVVGNANSSSISNSSYSGTIDITATDEITNVGGIVGDMSREASTISDSSSAGTITLTSDSVEKIGGAVGYAEGSNIDTVTSSVAIDASNVEEGESFGGLVGYNKGGVSTINKNRYDLNTPVSSQELYDALKASEKVSYLAREDVIALLNDGYVFDDSYSYYAAWSGLANITFRMQKDVTVGDITNSSASGNVIAPNVSSVGGLVGHNYLDGDSGSAITNSHASGEVKGLDNVGGLVGLNERGNIVTSYATGKVTGTSENIGGLVGYNDGYDNSISHNFSSNSLAEYTTQQAAQDAMDLAIAEYEAAHPDYVEDNNWNAIYQDSGNSLYFYSIGAQYYENISVGTITDSHATGNVVGNNNTGGLVGYNGQGTITNSYTTGSVVGNDYTGGLVGFHLSYDEYGNISGSYALGDVLGHNRVGGLAGTIKNEGNSVTSISNSYAEGKVQGITLLGGLIGYNQSSGTIITDSHATGDVVSSGYHLVNNQERAAYSIGGLIGYNQGKIINSYAEGTVSSETGFEVGGLVGDSYGSIINSYATGDVTAIGDGWAVGGLVGFQYKSMDDSILSGSYATGKVTGKEAVGGLVGGSENVDILNSYATGEVIGNTQVGGLAGYFSVNNIPSVLMEKSYATGKVTGTEQIGGLIGYTNSADLENVFATGDVTNTLAASTKTGALIGMSVGGTVSTSYASGQVTVGAETSANLGGLIGANDDSGTDVSDSFYDKTLNVGKSDEETSGKTTEELKSSATYSAWDITEDATLTDMYPRLAASGWVIKPAAGTPTNGGSTGGNTGGNTGGSTPTPVPNPEPTPTKQDPDIEKVITSIVNNTTTNVNLPKDILLPKFNLGQNTPILPMTPTIQASPVMQNLGKKLGLNQGEELSLVSTVFEGQTTQRITLGELKNLSKDSNNPNERRNTPIETRVALGDNSIVELVNGGVTLPEGVDQEFYVTKNKKNKKN